MSGRSPRESSSTVRSRSRSGNRGSSKQSNTKSSGFRSPSHNTENSEYTNNSSYAPKRMKYDTNIARSSVHRGHSTVRVDNEEAPSDSASEKPVLKLVRVENQVNLQLYGYDGEELYGPQAGQGDPAKGGSGSGGNDVAFSNDVTANSATGTTINGPAVSPSRTSTSVAANGPAKSQTMTMSPSRTSKSMSPSKTSKSVAPPRGRGKRAYSPESFRAKFHMGASGLHHGTVLDPTPSSPSSSASRISPSNAPSMSNASPSNSSTSDASHGGANRGLDGWNRLENTSDMAPRVPGMAQYMAKISRLEGVHVTVSSHVIWNTGGEINAGGKFIPTRWPRVDDAGNGDAGNGNARNGNAGNDTNNTRTLLPRVTDFVDDDNTLIFFFDDNLDFDTGCQPSSSGCCNLRDPVTQKPVDFSGFEEVSVYDVLEGGKKSVTDSSGDRNEVTRIDSSKDKNNVSRSRSRSRSGNADNYSPGGIARKRRSRSPSSRSSHKNLEQRSDPTSKTSTLDSAKRISTSFSSLIQQNRFPAPSLKSERFSRFKFGGPNNNIVLVQVVILDAVADEQFFVKSLDYFRRRFVAGKSSRKSSRGGSNPQNAVADDGTTGVEDVQCKLFVDINKTIMGADGATGKTVEMAISEVLFDKLRFVADDSSGNNNADAHTAAVANTSAIASALHAGVTANVRASSATTNSGRPNSATTNSPNSSNKVNTLDTVIPFEGETLYALKKRLRTRKMKTKHDFISFLDDRLKAISNNNAAIMANNNVAMSADPSDTTSFNLALGQHIITPASATQTFSHLLDHFVKLMSGKEIVHAWVILNQACGIGGKSSAEVSAEASAEVSAEASSSASSSSLGNRDEVKFRKALIMLHTFGQDILPAMEVLHCACPRSEKDTGNHDCPHPDCAAKKALGELQFFVCVPTRQGDRRKLREKGFKMA